jgi:hypothetical protein
MKTDDDDDVDTVFETHEKKKGGSEGKNVVWHRGPFGAPFSRWTTENG